MSYYGYIRVSSIRQGQQGVSLQEQRQHIEAYARARGYYITRWFEEKATAAKSERPVFAEMARLLQIHQADGVLIHKIDRAARNLKDWAKLGELIDSGIDVKFAHEGADLHSRGGRLAADIQAVVAADFIRNLREETRKGFYGRLRQGLYPCRTPLGYRDGTRGNPKAICPVVGPLVRKAFELYATQSYSLQTLTDELFWLGLRNRDGRRLSRNGLSIILNNPFYAGTIFLRRSGKSYAGIHEPLLDKALFERVQRILKSRVGRHKRMRHNFLFRRFLWCDYCGKPLIGEIQKGHTYYRCHTALCPIRCIREEVVLDAIKAILGPLTFSSQHNEQLEEALIRHSDSAIQDMARQHRHIDFLVQRNAQRMKRLTESYLDGIMDRTTFEEQRHSIQAETHKVEERRRSLVKTYPWPEVSALSPHDLFMTANSLAKQNLIRLFFNRINVVEKMSKPVPSEVFQAVARDEKLTEDVCRTFLYATGSSNPDRALSRLTFVEDFAKRVGSKKP